MAYLYWIKFPEHTDMFSEGYIGVTTKTPQYRFLQHVHSSRYPKHYFTLLGKEIRKRGQDAFEVKILVEAEEDYCYQLEEKLRPGKYIGWNIVKGGGKPPSPKGKKVSAESREKMSAAKKGKKQTKEHILKATEVRMSKVPWHRVDSRKDVWAKAAQSYLMWLECKSPWTVARKMNVPRHSLVTVFKWFERGYIPTEDSRWVEEFEERANGN